MDQWSDKFTTFFEADFLAGIPLSSMAYATAILVVFLLLRKLFTRFVLGIAKRFAKKTATDIDNRIIVALEEPLRFAFIIFGLFVAQDVLPLDKEFGQLSLDALQSLVTFTIFWSIYRLVEPLSFIFDKLSSSIGSSLTEDLKNFFVRALKIVIAFLGIVAILQEWGINVAAFLGGLGLAGMAVALAAKDTVSNMFGGLTIFADRTFSKGDWIETPFVEGTVEVIGIRATKIRSFAKALITVPNAKLADAPVINWSRMTNRRVKMDIGLEYRTTADQLERIVQRLRDYLANHPDIEQGVTQFVHLVKFGESSIDINLYYFTKTTNWLEWRDVVNQNIIDFKRIVEEEGTGFAFPSRSIYMEKTAQTPAETQIG